MNRSIAWRLVGVILLLLPVPSVGKSTILYASDAQLKNASIATKHDGFQGPSYANYSDKGGGSIAWTYNATSSLVEVTIRYAATNNRPLDLYVDGIKKVRFACRNTSSWSNWSTEKANVTIGKGVRTLKLSPRLVGPNVNWISLVSFDPFPRGGYFFPTASPRTDTLATSLILQAETAVLNKVSLGTLNRGFEGSGYADYQGVGSSLLWSINVSKTAQYEIRAKYASVNNRNCNLYIDNKIAGTFQFKGTGNWNTWAREVLVLSLTQGRHSLMIRADNSTGPNIDWVSIVQKCQSGCSSTPAPAPRTSPPTPPPTVTMLARDFPSRVVLTSTNNRLDRGEFVFSPNAKFKVGMTWDGDFVLKGSNGASIWSARTSPNGNALFLQPDGNIIVRSRSNQALWTSGTYDHAGAQLIVDDGGQIAVVEGDTPLWFDGIPRGMYVTSSPPQNIEFPVRGIFYYPWYPETWIVNGAKARFVPDLGFYSNSDPFVVRTHIDAFEYAWVDLVICSWWGPGTNQDRGRNTLMMDEIFDMDSKVKLSFYHEGERENRPSSQSIKSDLDYLKKWFAWHPSYAHVNNRPIIFVYNNKGCDVAERWMAASNKEWYVVLKLFPGFKDCAVQPDHWHQYGVSEDPLTYTGYSTTISPGFWRADLSKPLLPRLTKDKWCSNVNTMVQSNQPWQLIVTFNEHGEGTGVESSKQWSSNTGYGYYLDCLHQYH